MKRAKGIFCTILSITITITGGPYLIGRYFARGWHDGTAWHEREKHISGLPVCISQNTQPTGHHNGHHNK